MYQITRGCDAAATAPSSDAHPPHQQPQPQQDEQQGTTSPLFAGTTTPQDLDVLCGRHGTTGAFHHRGNQIYRDLVNRNKELYTQCTKSEKPKIARSIVAVIRERNGRFLEQDANNNNLWFDIGDKKAIEKTSQALRDGQAKRRSETGVATVSPAPSPTAGASPSPGGVVVPPPPCAAEPASAAPRPSLKAPPPSSWQPPPPLEQQQQQQSSSRQSLLWDADDAILQHLDDIMNLSLQDDNNEEEHSSKASGGEQLQPRGAFEMQDSGFSLMSGFSAFGTSAMSLGTTLQTLEEDSVFSPTSATGTAAANRRSSSNTMTSGSHHDPEDGMPPAIYMVESSSTLSSNISGLSDYSKNKQKYQQQQQQQQHCTAGAAVIPPHAAAAGNQQHHEPLPMVSETDLLTNSTTSSVTSGSEITIIRPDSMLTDDFYAQAKQGMMKRGSINKDHINNNNSMVGVVPLVPQFYNPPGDKNLSSSSSSVPEQQQQRHQQRHQQQLLQHADDDPLNNIASLMQQDAMMESSLSLQSSMSAITMTTLQTSTGHQSIDGSITNNNITQRQQHATAATAAEQQQNNTHLKLFTNMEKQNHGNHKHTASQGQKIEDGSLLPATAPPRKTKMKSLFKAFLN